MRIRSIVMLFVSVASCAPRAEVAPSSSSPPALHASSPAPPRPASSAPSSSPPKARPDAATIFARLKPGLVRCYEDGRRSIPTMLEGRLTLNASVDPAGMTTCVIPTEDTGLTQEVEECMSARFAAERFDEGSASTLAVPVVVRSGNVQLGERKADALVLESVETHHMPDAFDVLESLEPELQACVRAMSRDAGPRALIAGARVGADGRTQCALATSPTGVLPSKVADCASNVLRQAKFPPPKGGAGLILVPMALGR